MLSRHDKHATAEVVEDDAIGIWLCSNRSEDGFRLQIKDNDEPVTATVADKAPANLGTSAKPWARVWPAMSPTSLPDAPSTTIV